MKKLKSLLAIMSALSICMAMIPAAAPAVSKNSAELIVSAEEFSTEGTFGENISWTFDIDSGTLLLTGNGEIPEIEEYYSQYGFSSDHPWYDFKNKIITVKISEGITSIPKKLFRGCSEMTEVSLPKGLVYIGDDAFSSCYKLSKINLPAGLMHIGDNAFSRCNPLSEINLPDGLMHIGDKAFSGCALSQVTLPDSLETLGDEVFSYTKISSITLPKGIKHCGVINSYYLSAIYVDKENAVYSSVDGVLFDKTGQTLICYPQEKQDTEYHIPEGTTNIALDAFNQASIETLYIPSSLISMEFPSDWSSSSRWGYSLFGISLKHIEVDENNPAYCTDNGILLDKNKQKVICCPPELEIEEVNLPDTVTSIAPSAFKNCKSTKISIPNSVEDIGEYAFSCARMTEMKLPEGITSIKKGTFDGAWLESVIIPDTVKTIEEDAFGGSAIQQIDLNQVTDVQAGAFVGCIDLVSVTGDKVSVIGEEGFCGCLNIKSLSFPNVVTIHQSGLRSLDSLETLELPNVEFIGENCCTSSLSLQSITLPKAKIIETEAFFDCKSVTNVELPNIEEIGESAFCDAEKLQTVILSDKIKKIDSYAFSMCENLKEVSIAENSGDNTISNGVIMGSAFGGCFSLEKLSIPESIERIEAGAFRDAPLTELTIPGKVTHLGSDAFSSNNPLKKATILNPEMEMEESCISAEIIYGYAGSTAQTYAEEYEIEFIPLEGEAPPVQKFKKGDANGDGSIDILDVISINRTVLGKERMTAEQVEAVDFNKNNVPDATDSLTLMKYIVGLITTLE